MKPNPNSHGLFNQTDSLRYLISVYEEQVSREDSTDAAMYKVLQQIIKSESTAYFQKEYLEQLLKTVTK
jgi:endonuclease III